MTGFLAQFIFWDNDIYNEFVYFHCSTCLCHVHSKSSAYKVYYEKNDCKAQNKITQLQRIEGLKIQYIQSDKQNIKRH